ncbi:hypothetical protein HBI56_122330 [Parastagonospora nodorum]|nr:hypothetical protein HBH50_138850 [Parastagonospora nodorum]KAH4140291.1 hypothetical protein HBH45_084910 [Parastagonospora nodorum]KAH4155811.1 hypothetical protein HBH44_138840 [Parastagonospora nodorum]KAH4204928.1 hypothetical protein HBI95_141190 [Parastagonospora nodorum]KAH4315301.1 hypothetical protein HBI02_052900 [Parastagonospora nodorum]
MPSASNVESFLLSVLGEFEWHIREAGCWDSTLAAEIAKVKANLAELGEVITLTFAPRRCKEKAWGVTYNTKKAMRFHAEFSDTDRPRIKPEYSTDTYRRRHLLPWIVMNPFFMDYFRSKISSCTPTETYRVHFLFAITLVHEITHAYWFWFNEKTPEPVWHEGERNAELGLSWEREVIGRVVQPMLGYQGIDGIRTLILSELREYTNSKDRMDAVIELQDATKLSKTLTRHDAKRNWPLLKPSDLRGSELFLENSSQKYLVGIKCINMAWILRSLNVTSEGDAKIHKELQKEEKELTARKKQREKDKEDFRKAFVEMKL